MRREGRQGGMIEEEKRKGDDGVHGKKVRMEGKGRRQPEGRRKRER